MKFFKSEQELSESQEGRNRLAVRRMPFKKKLEHFWYYYKWATIFGAFLLSLVVYTIFQVVTNVKPDIKVVVMTEDSRFTPDDMWDMIDYFKTVTGDVNGDGKKEADVEIVYLGAQDTDRVMQTKLIETMMTSYAIIYITDDTTFDYYQKEGFFDRLTGLIPDARGVTEYKLPVKDTALASLNCAQKMEDLSVTVRRYAGTNIDKPANKVYYENALKALEKITLK